MTTSKEHFVGHLIGPDGKPQNVEFIAKPRPNITRLEAAAGIKWVDARYEPGNVFRYGAVADSALGAAGTDCTAAFQAAVDSGHAVYVPEGYFSIEGTLLIQSGGSTQGGKTFIMTSNTRLERFSASVNDPIIQVVGDQNTVDGNGGILAARAVGAFTEGLLLVGVNPTLTDNSDATAVDTRFNSVKNFKIIGLSATTGWDGSIGFYVNAAARKRGIWKTGGNDTDLYYNNFSGIRSQQWDYPVFVSSEASFNVFHDFSANNWGHAAYTILGYGNQCTGMISESPTAQDGTERFALLMGAKNSGPETGTDASATSIIAITGVSAASAASITTGAVHGLTTADTVKIVGVTDTGAGTLDAAINEGHWQVTVTDTTHFTIPLDTSALAAYSSGGTMQDNFLPNLGARTNFFSGSTETVLVGGSKVIRVFSPALVVGSYDVADITQTYDENVVFMQGAHPGGVGISGFTTLAGIGRNEVNTHAAKTIRGTPVVRNSFQFRELNDRSGDSFGTDESRTFYGRMAGAVENTAYNVLTIDNVGPNNGCALIMLTYLMREDVNDDAECGEISWLCPVAGNSNQTAIKYKDFQANYNTATQPFVNWSITDAAGTTASTGKFTLVATIDTTIAGTADLDITWKAEIMGEYGASLDFEADVTITNGGL